MSIPLRLDQVQSTAVVLKRFGDVIEGRQGTLCSFLAKEASCVTWPFPCAIVRRRRRIKSIFKIEIYSNPRWKDQKGSLVKVVDVDTAHSPGQQ
jgi:hypothetical protein